MDDDAFASVMAGIDSPAGDAATAAAPGDGSPPVDPTENPAPEPAPETPEQAPAPAPDQAPDPAPAVETQPAQPPAPAWDAPENPYLADARWAAQVREQLVAAQEQQRQAQIAQSFADLHDGDPEQQRKLFGLLQQVQEPLTRQAQGMEQRSVQSEKAATALWIAAQAVLPEAQREAVKARMEQLMALDGPEAMQRVAFTERDVTSKFAGQLTERDQRIADLERQIAARTQGADRDARGADRVDGGTAGAPSAAPVNIDDYFTRLFGTG